MRVAALYDIHGNLPALEAVLHEVRQAHVDQIVVGGDVIPGPMPHETLQRLLEIDMPIHFILGNGESEVLVQMKGNLSDTVPDHLREILSWVAQELPPEYEQVLASWSNTVALEIGGLGKVLFCHATPQNNTDIFTRLTPDERLLSIFKDVEVSIVVCGHTHMQFDRTVGEVRVVNAGSVGMPFADAGAYWLLLDSDIEFRHTTYNFSDAAARIRQTDYPQAQDFADNNVLNPPTEKQALATFSPKE